MNLFFSSVVTSSRVFLEQYRQNPGKLLALEPSYSSESLNLEIVCSCGLISIQVEDAYDHYHGHVFKHDQVRQIISKHKQSPGCPSSYRLA